MFLFLLNVLKDIFAGNRILIWHLFIFSTERCHFFCFQDCIISDEQSLKITVLSFSLQEICPFSFGYLQDFFFIFHFEQFDWRVWLWSMSLFWDNSWLLSLHIFFFFFFAKFSLPSPFVIPVGCFILSCGSWTLFSFFFTLFFPLCISFWIIYGRIFKFTGSFLSYVKSADESIEGIHFQYCGFSYQVFPFGSP